MVHGSFKEVTHMVPLHARIPLYIPCYALTNIKMARNFIDIHTYSPRLARMHSLARGDGLVNQAQVSSLVSKSIHSQPASRS